MKAKERTWPGKGGKLQTGWQLDFTNPVTGRRVRPMAPGAKSRLDALRIVGQMLDDLKEKKKAGGGQVGECMTLALLLRLHAQRPGIAAATVDQEENQGKNLLAHLGADVKVIDLRPSDLDAYATARKKQKKHPKSDKDISDATILKELKLLQRVCRWGVDRDVSLAVRLGRLPKLAPETKAARCLKPDEIEKLFEACGQDHETKDEKGRVLSPWLRQAVEFCYLTGLRRSELFALTWREVDFGNECITVRTKRGNAQDVRIDPVYTTSRRGRSSCCGSVGRRSAGNRR